MESKLRTLRKNLGLSARELGIKAKVNFRMILKYETGEKNIDHAKPETLFKLAEALNCKVSDIIENEDIIKIFN